MVAKTFKWFPGEHFSGSHQLAGKKKSKQFKEFLSSEGLTPFPLTWLDAKTFHVGQSRFY